MNEPLFTIRADPHCPQHRTVMLNRGVIEAGQMSSDAANDAPRFGFPVGPWIRAFAWLPTDTFDGGYVWLRCYWRRRIQKHEHLHAGPDFWWQCRRFESSSNT